MGKKKRRKIERPKVLPWYIAYCILLSLASLLSLVLGIILSRTDASRLAELDALPPVVYIVLGAIFFIPSVIGAFLPRQPKFWKWIYGLVLICIGMPSCCYLPIAIPLLIFWVQPETKKYFKG